MMRGSCASNIAGFLLVMFSSACLVDAALYIPVPPGSINTSKPHEVQVGGQVLEVSSYLTEMQEDDLIDFYNEVLPASGWRVSKLPWHAQHEKNLRKFQQAFSIHKDAPEAKQMKNRLNQYQAASALMERQIYAEKESDHVIINLVPRGDRMSIFINRWSAEQSRWIPQAKGVSQSGSKAQSHEVNRNNQGSVQADPSGAIFKDQAQSGGSEWLDSNICCTGEGLADQDSALPLGVPHYPGANAVAKSTSSDKKRTIIILNSTDSMDEVVDYYRRHMPYNGWTLSGENKLLDQGFGFGRILRYQKPDRYCNVNFQPVKNEQAETNLTETLLVPARRSALTAVASTETLPVPAEMDAQVSLIQTVITFNLISGPER